VDRSLRARGITTSHGGSYFDSITGKNRQYDVRAYAYIPDHCGIFFAIEYKSLSTTFPLIESRVPRPADDAYHELIRTWGRKETGEEFQDSIRSNERMPPYRVDEPVGKKTVQIGREERKSKDGNGLCIRRLGLLGMPITSIPMMNEGLPRHPAQS
jgi:hypothetical protein